MPYIKDEKNRRAELRLGNPAKIAGELNYQIFTHVKYDEFDINVIKSYVKNFLGKTPNYQRYNDITGALGRCCMEIQRRLKNENNQDEIYNIVEDIIDVLASYDKEIDDYEDLKIIENGDV